MPHYPPSPHIGKRQTLKEIWKEADPILRNLMTSEDFLNTAMFSTVSSQTLLQRGKEGLATSSHYGLAVAKSQAFEVSCWASVNWRCAK